MLNFRSSGKLLLSGEYLVLKGAKALALPTRFGQEMQVAYAAAASQEKLAWKAFNHEKKLWFEAEFNLPDLGLLSSSDQTKAEQLQTLLQLCFESNAKLFKAKQKIDVTTYLEFPENWGLGSSSTLICNLSKWSGENAFDLLKAISKASGYDVAVGLENKPIIYQKKDKKPIWEAINFNPDFKENIYFIHLNQKQKSELAIEYFEANFTQNNTLIEKTNFLTKSLNNTTKLTGFEYILTELENLISSVLQTPTIKEQLFPDYEKGAIKSLGAWGGDFILVTAKNKSNLNYFKEKGYNTILSYDEMILT